MPVTARPARSTDAPELVRLRALMFESMGLDTSEASWRSKCEAHLVANLNDGDLIGAVVDVPDGSGLAASGLAEVSRRIPSPGNPGGAYAYVSSFSTDPQWRRRGMAHAVMDLILGRLKELGVARVELHATPDGAELYRSFGFTERDGGLEMRLTLT